MQCATHPAEAATAICTRCDKLLCAACAQDYRGKTFCAGCAEFLGRRDQQRQAPPRPAPAAGPEGVYGGPPPGQSPPPAEVYGGPPPGQSPAPARVYGGPPPAGAPRQAVNPYESVAPGMAPAPPAAANPAPSPPPTPAPAPLAPPSATASRPPAVNPYQSVAPPVAPAPPAAANPYREPPPAAPSPQPASIGLDATLSPPPGDLYQEPLPTGDVYQGPPAGDVYQGPPAGDVYQGPPTGDVYQGPPVEGVYQGPPAEGVYQGPPATGVSQPTIMVTEAESEGSMGRALAFAAGFGLLAVLVWYGFSESTGGAMKAPLMGSFLGLVIGHSAVRGAGRGGGDVAMLSVGLTICALILGEVLIGYQPERMYIQMDFWDWVLYLIGLYEGWSVPAGRA